MGAVSLNRGHTNCWEAGLQDCAV